MVDADNGTHQAWLNGHPMDLRKLWPDFGNAAAWLSKDGWTPSVIHQSLTGPVRCIDKEDVNRLLSRS